MGTDQPKAILDNTPISILTPVQFSFNALVLIEKQTGARRFDAKNEFAPVEAFQTDVSIIFRIFRSDPHNPMARLLSSMVQEEYCIHTSAITQNRPMSIT